MVYRQLISLYYEETGNIIYYIIPLNLNSNE